MLSTSMISSSALHVGRHGSTHSLQQIHMNAARNLQQQPSAPDSPQLHQKRHHDTITEGEEPLCSEDGKAISSHEDDIKNKCNTSQKPSPGQTHKKGSIISHKDRR